MHDELSRGLIAYRFRWVACQLDALEKCCDPQTLRFTIASLPKTLDETYERIIARIPPEHMRHAIRLLQFLTYSERPLVDEAVDAIAVEAGPNLARGSRFDPKNRMPIPAEITIYCSSLVRKDVARILPSRKVLEEIQLAHFSVKDYLVSDRLEKVIARYLEERSARTLIAEVCLAYLLELNPKEGIMEQLWVFPFSEYSATYWASHAVVGEQNSITVRQLAMDLLQDPLAIAQLCRFQRSWMNSSKKAAEVGLCYVSLLGTPRCVGILLEPGADANAFDEKTMQAASAKSNPEVIQLLLENSANIHTEGGNYISTLQSALSGRNSHAIQVLRGDKTYIHVQYGLGGFLDLADVNERGLELFHLAALNGDIPLVNLLLDCGVEPGRLGRGQTVSHFAAQAGQIEVLEMLLDRGTDCFAADNIGWTSLIYAVSAGHSEVVKLLLNNGANVSDTDCDGWTPLYSATDRGHTELVKFLLKIGADPSATSNDGSTLLHSAAYHGHIEVAKVLLKEGADLSLQTKNGWSPLSVSAHRGDLEVTKLLLEKGADSSVTNKDGWAPLSIAANKGHVEVVKLLLKATATGSTVDQHGIDAVHSAALKGHTKVVQILLENGVDAMAQDCVGRSILFLAIKSGSSDLFSVLLDRVPSLVDLKDHYGSTALSVAARFGRTDMVMAIASLPESDLKSEDKFGRTALWWARTQTHNDIASILIDSAVQRGISMPDLSLPIGTFALYSRAGGWCDVCMSNLAHLSRHYYCKLCAGGDFHVCLKCRRLGAQCLDASHFLEFYEEWVIGVEDGDCDWDSHDASQLPKYN